jgi:hypothetical protein
MHVMLTGVWHGDDVDSGVQSWCFKALSTVSRSAVYLLMHKSDLGAGPDAQVQHDATCPLSPPVLGALQCHAASAPACTSLHCHAPAQVCDQLDERLESLAHSYQQTYFCRVAVARSSALQQQLGLEVVPGELGVAALHACSEACTWRPHVLRGPPSQVPGLQSAPASIARGVSEPSVLLQRWCASRRERLLGERLSACLALPSSCMKSR